MEFKNIKKQKETCYILKLENN